MLRFFDGNEYSPFGYHEFEQSEIQSRRLLILYSAKTTPLFTKTQSSRRSHPQQQGKKTSLCPPLPHIPLQFPHFSAAPEYPAPPFSQWSCWYILPPHQCRNISFFQLHSTFSSGPGTCSGVPCPARW